MASLANLKGQRTRLTKKIDQTIESATKVLSVAVPDDGLDGISEVVDSHISLCKDLSERFEVLSSKIVEAMDERSEAELEAEGEMSAELVFSLAEIIAKLSSRHHKIVGKLHSLGPVQATADSDIKDQLQQLINLETSKHGVKEQTAQCTVNLPKLDFEPFHGDILKWSEFWDSFSASVHLNSNLQAVQKLAYLRAKLRGDAKAVIAGLETTNENYEVALSLLRERFGNKQAAISAHYGKLMDLPSSPNQTEKLRTLTDVLEQQLCCLSSLGEDVDHRHFISMILHKLPEAVIIKLEEMKAQEEEWSVKLLRSKLQAHLAARESAVLHSTNGFGRSASGFKPNTDTKVEGQKPQYNHNNRNFRSKRMEYSTTETLYSNERDQKKKPDGGRRQQCLYCGGNHWNDECNKYKTVSARKRQIQGRCFNCLSKGHKISECYSTRPCFHCKTTKKHHSSLCPRKFSDEKETSQVAAEGEEDQFTDESLLASGERALLQTASVAALALGSQKQRNVRLLFDSGSHRSYISSEAAKRLNLQSSGTETISVNTFACRKAKTVQTQVVEVQLKLQDGTTTKIVANVVPTISSNIRRQPLNLSKYKDVLKGLRLADPLPVKPQQESIDVLIGSDYYVDLLTFEKRSLGDNLYLLGSKFGWILAGRSAKNCKPNNNYSMLILNVSNQSVPELCRFQAPDKCSPIEINTEDFWSLETIGIKEPTSDLSDEQAIAKFNNTVQCKDGRYFVKWPWREEHPDLPSNFQLSLGRLKSAVRKLSSNPDMLRKYNDIIADQVKKGVVEKVTQTDEKGALTHYIPHQAVVTPQKYTTKIRIVYDASAKVRKEAPSLNECLLRGPVILENLCGLLMRFRLHNYAVVADIEKAFLQVGLQHEDRDVVRFLWLKDPSKPSIENNLQQYRFTRVPFGVISSPFLLAATIVYHLSKANSITAKQIVDHMYVDNMITSVSTPQQLQLLYKEGKQLFKAAKMNLREWTSNNRQFVDALASEDKCHDKRPKVLGLNWDTTSDSLNISGAQGEQDAGAVTKRQVFKKIAKVFDPLGLVSPVVIRAKIFLQSLWSEKVKWDENLSSQQEDTWKSQLKELSTLSQLSIPRHLGIQESSKAVFRLVAFCDASAKAYASVVYLQWTDETKASKSALVFSKSRLAPVKRQTIPRLELLALVIGVRALKFVEEHLRLPISEKSLWSDSQCALHWIASTKPQSVFVKNRISEIKAHKDVSFNYVKSEENPADLPSRGTSTEDLKVSELWWTGPPWLTMNPANWPKINFSCLTEGPDSSIGPTVLYEASMKATEADVLPSSPYNLKAERYSSLMKLLRVTAWANRFVDLLQHKETRSSRWISASEIGRAKAQWEIFVQQSEFPEVGAAVSDDKKNELITKFKIYRDENNTLRCKGRLQNMDLPEKTKFPALLPRKSHFTKLIIEEIHRRLMHAGSSQTLAELRREYWIPQGRRLVQAILSTCNVCRRWEGGPFKMPEMPPIPSCRVVRTTPFTFAGVDYFGPLYVKSRSGRQKVWVCLFTCMTIRAIHLELANDLSAEEFIMSFRRFISRRGTPQHIYSDNGINFQAASKVLSQLPIDILSGPDMQTFVAAAAIRWHFIPQFSPWMGGFYERLVGLVKRHLRKAIGRVTLTFSQFLTILCEAEAIVNSRPLVYVDEDIASDLPLTPSHFLSLNPKTAVQTPPSCDDNEYKDPEYFEKVNTAMSLLRTWKKGNQYLDQFWKLWEGQYLLSLRERTQRQLSQPHRVSKVMPQSGDVVLVKDGILPRGSWKVARITDLLESSDGQHRSAKLMLPSHKQLIRPLSCLYPIECAMNAHNSTLNRPLLLHLPTPAVPCPAVGGDTQSSESNSSCNRSDGDFSPFALLYVSEDNAISACSAIKCNDSSKDVPSFSQNTASSSHNPLSSVKGKQDQISSLKVRTQRKTAQKANLQIKQLVEDGQV